MQACHYKNIDSYKKAFPVEVAYETTFSTEPCNRRKQLNAPFFIKGKLKTV